jgi:hypothetical protein
MLMRIALTYSLYMYKGYPYENTLAFMYCYHKPFLGDFPLVVLVNTQDVCGIPACLHPL